MHDIQARLLALPVQVLLIASVVIVSLLGWLFKPVQGALILNPFRVRANGHVHRLLTAGWVHSNISHLVFNMLALYLFAAEPLRVLGTTRFLVLYVSAVIMGFVPTTLRHMRNPRYLSLGASGAVAAVMFCAILFNPKLRLYIIPIPVPVPAIAFAVGYLAYSAWHSYRPSDGINHDAHFAGAVYGVLFAYVFEPAHVKRAIESLM